MQAEVGIYGKERITGKVLLMPMRVGLQAGVLFTVRCTYFWLLSYFLNSHKYTASQKDFGGVLVKSNRWRFCPRLLYLCSSEVQGC